MKLEQYLVTEMAISNAAYDETAACIGIIIPKKYVGIIAKVAEHKGKKPWKNEDNQVDAREAHEYIMTTLNQSNHDWNKSGASLIKKVKPTDYEAIADLCRIIYGMYLFVQDRILEYIPSPNFIHGSITDYRRVETKVVGKEPSEKANTADVVITNAKTVTDLDNALEKGQIEVHPEPHEGYATAGPYTLFQISLKKSLQARVGKATTAAQATGLVPKDVKAELIKKELIQGVKITQTPVSLATKVGDGLVLYGSRLNEGILQTVGSFLKRSYALIMDKIRPLLTSLKAEVSEAFKTRPTENDFIEVLRLYKTNEEIEELLDELNEAKKPKEPKPPKPPKVTGKPRETSPGTEYLYVKRKQKGEWVYKVITGKVEQETVLAISSDPATIIKRINGRLQEAVNKTRGTDIEILIEKIPAFSEISGNRTEIIQTCFSLACNYVTANFIINFIDKADKMSENIQALVKSMKFGGTKIPIWKVFSYPTSPEYLGSTETEDVVSLPTNLIDPLGVSAHPNTKGFGLGEYYVFNILMLEDLSEEDKTYVRLRSGSFSGSHISYAIEGDKLEGPYPIEKPLEDILRKVKD